MKYRFVAAVLYTGSHTHHLKFLYDRINKQEPYHMPVYRWQLYKRNFAQRETKSLHVAATI